MSPKSSAHAMTCCSYLPGHTTHYIAPLRAYAEAPRDPITVMDADADGWIRFRDQESKEQRWWHHDAARVIALRDSRAPFTRVRGSSFLVAQRTENEFAWIYCSETPSPCAPERSTDLSEAIRNEGGFSISLAKHSADAETLAEEIADGIIANINADGAANGLPPLEDD